MPEIQTLDELKAENAKAEEEAVEETATETEELEQEAAEETNEDTKEAAEPAEEESEEKTVESWMESDDSGDSENSFNNSDMAAMRKKLKAKASKKLEEKDSEIEKLKAEVSQLKSGGSTPQSDKAPDRYDFDDDETYSAALADWIATRTENRIQTQHQAAQQKVEQAKAVAEREKLVNAHYERAATLTKEHGIDPELYQASDLAVRKAVASVDMFRDSADDIVDHLISRLGNDSEKVLFHVGRNKNARNDLRDALEEDPTGIKAAILLGQKKVELTAPKKVTATKKPAKRAEGDTPTGTNDWQRKYQRAKDPQARFDIRREAKKAGVDVRHW